MDVIRDQLVATNYSNESPLSKLDKRYKKSRKIEELPSSAGDGVGVGSIGLRRRGILSFGLGLAFEIEPIGEGGEGGEGEPEAAGAEARRRRPEESELAAEAEEDEPRPARPPRPTDHQADHHGQPNRNRA